jgi:hypothetical protein
VHPDAFRCLLLDENRQTIGAWDDVLSRHGALAELLGETSR